MNPVFVLTILLLLGLAYWLGYRAGIASHGGDDDGDWRRGRPEPPRPLDKGGEEPKEESRQNDRQPADANDYEIGRK